ncbi:MAG: DNA-3-methyladenine glycosylase [Verrucomicrobiota bacterium]
MSRRVASSFFKRHPVECARELIGSELVCGKTSGIVVETEAYCAIGDEAAHTFVRKTARDFVEELQAGAAYVYLNYGMYWLANVLVKGKADGFVLIRALEPKSGIEVMKKRRGRERLRDLCSGPGKLTIALGIDGNHHRESFTRRGAPFYFRERKTEPPVETDRRVGISKAVDLPWRFVWKDSPFLSVKPPAPLHRHKRR